MKTIFGDFAFRITASVQDAINGIKNWDKTMTVALKDQAKAVKEQKNNLTYLQKSWQTFGNVAKSAMGALGASIMHYSPHIRASLTMMQTSLKLISMDIGRTIAPAFKVLDGLLRGFTKWWRELGKVKNDASTEKGSAGGVAGMFGFSSMDIENLGKSIHDAINWVVGLGAVIITLAGAFKVLGMIFGGGSAAAGASGGVVGAIMGGLSAVVGFITGPFFIPIAAIMKIIG